MENPYEAFNYLNIGYSPTLYQISENGQSNDRIDAVSIASGENVSLLFLKVLLKMTAYVRNGYTFLIILDKQIGLGSYKMN